MRGSFTCEGYNTRTTWQKQSNAKGPVPLQSKDGFEGSDHTYSAEGHSPRAKRESAPYEGGHQMRPIVVEEGEPHTHYVTSPSSAGPSRNRSSYSQTWGRNPSYLPDQARPDLPPISELAREPDKQSYPIPPMREYPRTQSTSQQSSGSWPPHSAEYRHGYPPGPVDSGRLQGVAREGLSMEETQRTMMKGDELQREKMLNGQLFKYTDPLLVEDRKRCNNPTMGVAETERARKLREIFAPTRNPLTNMSYAFKWDPMGAIGPGSIVETPFKCQYGYNIRIGEDVFIGENCTIVDSCTVSIGAKTWIGQNVQILTAMAHTGMSKRAGSAASWIGKAVTIAEDVHIGAGAIIYPGVTINRGAQIEPGTVVKKDVENYAQGTTLEFMM
jgi:acetyltransferase-like isoleucine patch superfamily enzyme